MMPGAFQLSSSSAGVKAGIAFGQPNISTSGILALFVVSQRGTNGQAAIGFLSLL